MARIGVGIDIGHGSIKIVQIVKKKEQCELVSYAKITVPSDALDDDGMVTQEALITEAIHQACLQARIKTNKAIIAVAGNSVTIKHIYLPVMLGPQLGQVIHFETEKLLSYPISEAEYDWDILQQDDNGQMKLMIVAAPKKIVTSQLACCRKAGLQVLAVDAQPFTNMRTLHRDVDDETDNLGGIVILDIGLAMTQMAIFCGERRACAVRETRIIKIAGDLITSEIAEGMQISFEKAEAIKCNLGDADYYFIDSDNDTEIYQVNQIIRRKIAELVVEIRRSLDYFKLQFPDIPIHQFILTGGACKLRNLAPHLEHELGIAVKLGNPLTGLLLGSKMNRAVLLGNPYQFSIAIGLALRGVEYL